MNPTDAFGVVVRSIGLLLVLSAFFQLFVVAWAPAMLILAVPTLLIGLWLLRGAAAVVAFAYPESNDGGFRAP